MNSRGPDSAAQPTRAAAIRGDLGVFDVPLDAGVDPRLADDDGDTVLHYAAYNGRC